jgi:hypothetical protein
MFQTKVSENIETHILCSGKFSPENRTVYEIMWKNIVEPDMSQTTVWYDQCALRVQSVRLQI